VTLEGDTTIKTRATGKISGSLTGDCNLTVVNAASNRVGAITLTNAVNSTNSLTVQGASGAVVHLILAGNYTADEYVTIGGTDGGATIREDATLTSPVVNVNNRGVLRGVGSVVGDVVVAAGGTIEGGEADIYNSTDSVYYLDVDNTIGTLDVTGNVTMGGTLNVEYNSDTATIDLVNVSGELNLTGGTINLTNLGTATLSGGPYVFATYGSLTGSPTVTGTIPVGYEISYTYNGNNIALVPEPSTFILLALAGLALAAYKRRRG
jgi:hypothetical protein